MARRLGGAPAPRRRRPDDPPAPGEQAEAAASARGPGAGAARAAPAAPAPCGTPGAALTGLDALLADVAALALEGCTNPYRDADHDARLDRPGAAAIRRANLGAYLGERSGAPFVLVGEAMGYQGGRFSGMAFTSERQLAAWGPPYRCSSTRPGGFAEPSATVIHGVLAELGAERRCILWNTVPAHPHRAGEPLSNRAPRRAEVEAGRRLLERALALLQPQAVVAVGRVAERTLGDLATAAVRHPAQGGATACRAGLRSLLA